MICQCIWGIKGEVMLEIFLGNKYSRFTWELENRASSSQGIWFLEFLGDAAGNRQGSRRQSKPASFERSGPGLRTNLKDFAKPPSVPRTSRRLLSWSTAWGRMKTSRTLWQLKVCHFSLPSRTFPLSPSSPSHYLRFALFPSSSRDLSSSSPAPPPLVPLAVRFWREGDRQPCPVERVNKDEAKIRSREGKGRLLTREWEGSRNPTGWNNRLRLCAH